MEALGLEAASRLGFVLVAGGLGERLGYSGIKVSSQPQARTTKPHNKHPHALSPNHTNTQQAPLH
jgi:hypothetical protein